MSGPDIRLDVERAPSVSYQARAASDSVTDQVSDPVAAADAQYSPGFGTDKYAQAFRSGTGNNGYDAQLSGINQLASYITKSVSNWADSLDGAVAQFQQAEQASVAQLRQVDAENAQIAAGNMRSSGGGQVPSAALGGGGEAVSAGTQPAQDAVATASPPIDGIQQMNSDASQQFSQDSLGCIADGTQTGEQGPPDPIGQSVPELSQMSGDLGQPGADDVGQPMSDAPAGTGLESAGPGNGAAGAEDQSAPGASPIVADVGQIVAGVGRAVAGVSQDLSQLTGEFGVGPQDVGAQGSSQ